MLHAEEVTEKGFGLFQTHYYHRVVWQSAGNNYSDKCGSDRRDRAIHQLTLCCNWHDICSQSTSGTGGFNAHLGVDDASFTFHDATNRNGELVDLNQETA